jgi:hypothetical protein
MTAGYDIVGDIHGHYDHLEAMLRQLGYAERDGAGRQAREAQAYRRDALRRDHG